MAIESKLDAVCYHTMMDSADMKENRYHYGHTTGPVWTLGDNYYAATKIATNEKPPKHRDGEDRWNWRKKPDAFVEAGGWQIWIAYGSDEI